MRLTINEEHNLRVGYSDLHGNRFTSLQHRRVEEFSKLTVTIHSYCVGRSYCIL